MNARDLILDWGTDAASACREARYRHLGERRDDPIFDAGWSACAEFALAREAAAPVVDDAAIERAAREQYVAVEEDEHGPLPLTVVFQREAFARGAKWAAVPVVDDAAIERMAKAMAQLEQDGTTSQWADFARAAAAALGGHGA